MKSRGLRFSPHLGQMLFYTCVMLLFYVSVLFYSRAQLILLTPANNTHKMDEKKSLNGDIGEESSCNSAESSDCDEDDMSYESDDSVDSIEEGFEFGYNGHKCQEPFKEMEYAYHGLGKDLFEELESNSCYWDSIQRVEEDSTDDWERAGKAIGGNMFVRMLELEFLNKSFAQGLASNRSLCHLHIRCKHLCEGNLLSNLSPMLEHNQHLRCLQIRDCCETRHYNRSFWDGDNQCGISSTNFQSLVLALDKCTSLQRIDLGCNKISDEQSATLFRTLSGHPNLKAIHFDSNRVGRKGCKALGDLLQSVSCNVKHLYLAKNDIDDECLVILTSALVKNTSVQSLSLECSITNDHQNPITEAGWERLFSCMSKSKDRWVGIQAGSTKMNDRGLTAMAKAMSENTNSLKRIDLGYNSSIGDVGWQAFSNSLGILSSLVVLDLSRTKINDQMLLSIGNELVKAPTLKSLDISTILDVTSLGWQNFFRVFPTPESSLESLILYHYNQIDDQAFEVLVDVLSNNSTLKNLNIMELSEISPQGWSVLLPRLLSSPNSKLKEICLSCNRIDDRVAIGFANALRQNTCLEKIYCETMSNSILTYDTNAYAITAIGWKAFCNVLCDKASIMSIYSSNHTLKYIHTEYFDGARELHTLLGINEPDYKKNVARRKIIKYHFSAEEDNMEVFTDMDLSELPQAISWIGKDRLGFSLMYKLALSLPSLFEAKSSKSNK